MGWVRVRVLLCAVLLAVVVPAWAQLFRLPDIRIPGLDGRYKDEPPVTTSLQDAVTEVPVLDGFSPQDLQSVDAASYQPGQGFPLVPGVFAMEAQSFSLNVGAYEPTKDERYVYAPLAGPQSGPVRSILENSALYPDISQHAVQILIWAIAARANFDELGREQQQLVARLLTRTEVANVNGASHVTDEVRNAADPGNTLRVKLTTGPVVYDELERIAIRTGAHERGPDSRGTPVGRWSYHPSGFFIRLFPSGYSRTRVELSVPPSCAITRDERGRIVRVEDGAGHALACRYGAAVLAVPGEKTLSGAVLDEIRLTRPAAGDAAWSSPGWVFVGLPSGKGHPGEDSPGFSGVKARHEAAARQSSELGQLVTAATRSKKRDRAAMADLADLQQLRSLVASVSGDSAHEARLLLDTAWQSAFVRAARRAPQTAPDADAPDVVMFNPTDSVAVPADTAGQRLALSPRLR